MQTLPRSLRVVVALLVMAAVSLLAGLSNTATAAQPADVKLQPGDKLPRGRWIDALKYVDLDWDVVSGDWRRGEDGLTTEPSKMSRVMLPFDVQGDYDIEAEFTRTTGDGSVNIVLPVGERACQLTLAGWWQTMHGLWRIDGAAVYDHDNPAKFRPGKLVNERRYRVRISVRTKKDHASIDVSLDGKPIIAWKGRRSSLSVAPYMAMPYSRRAGIGAYDSTVTYHSVTLQSVSGKTKLAPRPEPPFKEAKDGQWIDLLSDVDPDRDAVHGRWVRLKDAVAVAPASADEGFVRLMLPRELEGSYNLVVEFTRVKGSESVTINLPVATRACTLHFGSFLGGVAGLEQIDGKDIGNSHNPAVRRPGSLVNGTRYTVLVGARSLPCPRVDDHDVLIDVWLNGKPFVRWTGRESSLSLAKWKYPERRRVGLGSNHGVVTFHAVRVKKVEAK